VVEALHPLLLGAHGVYYWWIIQSSLYAELKLGAAAIAELQKIAAVVAGVCVYFTLLPEPERGRPALLR